MSKDCPDCGDIRPLSAQGAARSTVRYCIQNMDCPTEEALIRDKLRQLPGVISLDFNLVVRVLTVHHELTSLASLEEALAAIDMHAVPVDTAVSEVETSMRIAGMDCPTEEGLIRSKLSGLPSVKSLAFNLVQRRLTVRHAAGALPEVLAGLQSLGFEADVEATQGGSEPEPAFPTQTAWWPLTISGAAALLAEAASWLEAPAWLVIALALFAIGAGGLSTYKKGWIALRNRNLNMNALMSIAVTGAMLIGHWPEAAMVMVLFALAEVIEAKSLDRARNAIRGLMELAPERATVLQGDRWVDMDAKSIALDSRVRVKPGERIALDGVVVLGRSTVNQAPITGESLPVDKVEGDLVFAGTINEAGSLEYRVTAMASDSTLARIIHAVEAAQGSRAPTQRFVDQFARW
jgi:Zn2+/Cd2+-exporting ATPase